MCSIIKTDPEIKLFQNYDKGLLMNILRNILSNPSIKSAHFIDNRTLMQIGLIVLKEAEVQEKRSSKRPGIAAIEYLLNCKYDIIEQYDLNSHAKDQILGTIDKVINQFAKKYGIINRVRISTSLKK